MIHKYNSVSLRLFALVVVLYLIWATYESFPISALIWPGVAVSRWLDLPFLAFAFVLAEWAFRAQAAWTRERHGTEAEDLAAIDGCLGILIVLFSSLVGHLAALVFMDRMVITDASMVWAFAGSIFGCLFVVSYVAWQRRLYRKERAA